MQAKKVRGELRESEGGKSINEEAKGIVPNKRLAKEDATAKIASIQLKKDEKN